MTRSQLILILAARLDVDRRAADAIVRSIFDAMTQSLRHGRSIEIRGFGSFSVRRQAPYRGRNPRSGEAVAVDEKAVAAFKAGRPMRARLEEKGASARRPRAGATRALRPLAARRRAE